MNDKSHEILHFSIKYPNSSNYKLCVNIILQSNKNFQSAMYNISNISQLTVKYHYDFGFLSFQAFFPLTARKFSKRSSVYFQYTVIVTTV